MKDFHSDALRIDIRRSAVDIELKWHGQSTSRRPGDALSPFFGEVLTQTAGRKLVVDFRGLEFMNSSTVRPIIDFLDKARNVAPAIEVRYHSTVTWQRLSFKVVEALAKQWANVTFES